MTSKCKHPPIPVSEFFGTDEMGCFFTIPHLFDQCNQPLKVYLDGFDDNGRLPIYAQFIGQMAASAFLGGGRKDLAKQWFEWKDKGDIWTSQDTPLSPTAPCSERKLPSRA